MDEIETTDIGSVKPVKKQKGFCKFKRCRTIILVVVVLLIVGGAAYGGYYYYKGRSNNDNNANTDTSQIQTQTELPEVVAIVNGDEIKRDEFLKRVQLASVSYTSQGIDISSAETQNQILQNIINTMISEKIVLQYAVKNKIKVTDEEIDTEYQKIVDYLGGEQPAKDAIASQGLDEEYVRKDIERQLTIQAYLSFAVDLNSLAVSDEEIQTAYNNITPNEGEEKPALEDISEDIKNELLDQKRQEVVNNHVNSLINESSVQVMF